MQNKKLPIQRRTALDDARKEQMLAIIIRNQEAFDSLHEVLNVEHVQMMGDTYGAVWKVVKACYEKYGELPDKDTLLSHMHQECSDNPDLLDEEELGQADVFLAYAFDNNEHGKDISKSKAHYKVAMDTCKRFMEEFHALEFRDHILKDGQIPLDLLEEIDKKKTELEIVGSLTDVSLDVPFPEGWDTEERVKLFTTGLEVLDNFFGGGWANDEVILFMGPYGSCKSSLVCHAVSELIKIAKLNYEKALANRKKRGIKRFPKKPVVVLVFTEGSKNDYRRRILSHLAQIPWAKLTRMKSIEHLSKSNKPGSVKTGKGPGGNIGTEYEKIEFKEELEHGDGFRSEYIRVKTAINMANNHLVMIDCTDSEDSPHQIGRGGIPEIANIVAAHFRKYRKTTPLCFWIDHASALADRIVEVSEKYGDTGSLMRTVLKRIVRQCKDKLAKTWKVPVAVIHQLSGEAAGRSPTAKQHHTDAADCKGMAEYADFAVVTGMPDESQMAKFSCTKHRREPPTPYRIVEIVGNFNRIVDRTETHRIDEAKRMILSKEEISAYHANASISKKPDYSANKEVDVT